MAKGHVVRALTKPGADEVQEAIHTLVKGADQDVQNFFEAGLIITSEACFMLDFGKTQTEIIASLVERGLPADMCLPFVEKASEIVQSNSSVSGNERSGDASRVQGRLKVGLFVFLSMALLYLVSLLWT